MLGLVPYFLMALDEGLLSLPTRVVPQRPELLALKAVVASRGRVRSQAQKDRAVEGFK